MEDLFTRLLKISLCLAVLLPYSVQAQYSMTETGITITFDGFDASTGPLAATPSASQLDSDNWAVDLDNDNDFDMNSGGGFGDSYTLGEDFTANSTPDWDDYGSENTIHSYDYNLDGLLSTAPAMAMAITANFGTSSDAMIAKIQNTGVLEITDIEVELDAFYYYLYEAWAGVPDADISIYHFVSSTNITNDLSSASWTELAVLTHADQTTDGWKQINTSTYGINGVSLSTNEYLYLKFVFNPNNPTPLYAYDYAFAMDNISLMPVGFAGTDATTTLAIDESASNTTVSTTSSSSEIFRFDIVDNGATDGYPTTFSSLVISSGTSNAITDWTTLFESVTLTDETGGGSTTATIGTSTLTFSGLSFASATDIGYVTDATTKTYSLNIDFVDTYAGSQDVDNQLLQFLVESSNIEIEGVSSTFETANAIETNSSNNVMAVTADRLSLQNEPSVVGTGTTSDVYFGFSLETVDAAGHLDLDVSSSFTITETTETLNSGAALSFSSGSATTNFSSGIYSFSDLFFDTSGAYTISFSSAAGYTATNFSVTAATSWRSVADGDWGNSTGTVWEYFIDGTGWATAGTNENPNATSASVGPIYIYNTVAIETTGYSSDQLFVESGGTLDINNTFTIADDGTSSYDLTVEAGGTVDVEADVTLTGTFNILGGSSIGGGGLVTSGTIDYIIDFGTSSNGYWETYSTLRYTTNAGVTFGGNQTFFPNAGTSQYAVFQNSGGPNYGNFSGDDGNTITINGIFYNTVANRLEIGLDDYVFRNGMISTSELNNKDLTSITGDSVFLSGTLYRSESTLEVTFSDTAPTVLELLGNVTTPGYGNNISYDFQSGGTLVLNDYTFVCDNITLGSGSTVKVSNSSGFGADQFGSVDNLTVIDGAVYHFNGTTAQSTGFGTLDGGTSSVSDIVVDNAAGLTNDSDLTVTNAITFEQGILNAQATSPGVLTIANATTFSGYSSSAHIQGPVSFASFASSKFIPIGDDNGGVDYYRPLIVDPSSSMTLTTAYTRSDPNVGVGSTFDTDGTNNPQSLTTSGYYTITFGATGTADVALYFDGSADAIAGSGDLIVAKYDNSASEWVGYESTSFGTDYVLATVTIDDLADTQFAIASVGASLLPVELLDFTASSSENHVVLNWSTASELNNDRFQIEHASNTFEFTRIDDIIGAGTTNDEQHYEFIHTNPEPGINYYRLKQIDFDGAYEYSPIVAIDLLAEKLQLLGNPVKNRMLRFIYPGSDRPTIRIISSSGNEVKEYQLEEESSSYSIDVSSLNSGLYLLIINDGVKRFIVEN